MTAAAVPERFERDMAGSEADWLRLLPPALAPHPWQREDAAVNVVIGHGRLRITWVSLPPRRIALLTLPMLRAQFAFEGVPAEARSAFMRRFDLHTHRGGGQCAVLRMPTHKTASFAPGRRCKASRYRPVSLAFCALP